MKILLKTILSLIGSFGFLLLTSSVVSAASFDFSPANGNFIQGCTSEIVLVADTAGDDSNAADVEITFNPAKIQIIDSKPGIPGIQVGTGNAYEAYFVNEVSGGTIRIAAGSFVQDLNGSKTFARIQFQSIGATANANFTINFTGAGDTLDSNIAETSTSLDLLTSVTNGSYTFSAGACIADTTPPNIVFNYPTNGATGVPSNANINVNISDTGSGVDISTVRVIINGVEYKNGDPQFSFSGSPANYNVIVDPTAGIPQGAASSVIVIADDLAGNTASRIITFNIPTVQPTPTPTPGDEDLIPPTIDPQDPTDGQLINVDTDLEIILEDENSGVDIDTLIIILNGIQYTIDSDELSYSGNPNQYIITIDPAEPLPTNGMSYMTIFVKDNSGNAALKALTFGPDPAIYPPEECDCPTPPPGTVTDGTIVVGKPVTDFLSGARDTIQKFSIPFLTGLTLFTGFLNFGAYPRFLLYAWAWFYDRKKYTAWGIVYDETNREPIPFATVRLYDKAGNFIKEKVTDLKGRYGFPVNKGSYKLEVVHSNFDKYTKEINIPENDMTLAEDIPMHKGAVSILYPLKRGLRRVLRKINNFVVVIGFFVSIIAVLINPIIYNFIILVVYIIQFSLLLFSRKDKNWGYVYDINNGGKIRGAFVRLFDPNTSRQLDVQLTDESGRYGFAVDAGKYRLTSDTPGYLLTANNQAELVSGFGQQKFLEVDIKTSTRTTLPIPMKREAASSGF